MTDAEFLIAAVLSRLGKPATSTKLVKLVYLIDYLHYQFFGSTATGFSYQWDRFGPNALGHTIIDTANVLTRRGVLVSLLYPNAYGGDAVEFEMRTGAESPILSERLSILVDDAVAGYGNMTNDEITAVSKETEPFKTAEQYQLLTFERRAPAVTAPEGDLAAHFAEVEESGLSTMSEAKERLGMR